MTIPLENAIGYLLVAFLGLLMITAGILLAWMYRYLRGGKNGGNATSEAWFNA